MPKNQDVLNGVLNSYKYCMNTRVKELRERKKLTQLGLAIRAETSQQTISKIESGVCIPKADLAIRLATIFNVSLDYLFELSNSKWSIESQIFCNKKLETYFDLIVDFDKLNDDNKETIRIILQRFLDIQEKDIG